MVATRYRGSAAHVRRLLRQVPAMLSGQKSDTIGVRDAVRDDVAKVLFRLINEAFATKKRGGRGSDGITWQPTKKQKLPPEYIGVESQRMLESLAFGGPESIVRMQGGTIIVGTSVPWAQWFHSGVPARNLPPRPLWPEDDLPPAWIAEIAAAVSAAIVRSVTAAIAKGVRP